MKDYAEIYKASLEKWGAEAQYDQAIKECAELIAALKHFKRGRIGTEAVVAELADVWLMVHQLAYMLGEDKLSQAVEEKLRKLATLLAEP
ncbi:MAG: antitoxin [Desulfuromonadales bacterium]|nr:antitoxin [Desulfuromonadales bacterium]